MEPWHLSLLLGGVALFGGLIRLAQKLSGRDRSLAKRLSRIPSRPIKDAVDGKPARITGSVRPLGNLLTAPLTERSCIAFEVLIERTPGGAEPHRESVWRTSSFLVDDPTGTAIVDGGQLFLSIDDFRRRADLPPRLQTFLVYEGKDPARVTAVGEGAIEPGSSITVCGVAHWETDPDPRSERGYRDTPLRLRFESTPETKVIISNDPTVLDQ